MKTFVERPFVKSFSTVQKSEVLLSIDVKIDFCHIPNDAVGMKLGVNVFSKGCFTHLSSKCMIKIFGMNGLKNGIRIVTYMFHDVDFATVGPAAVFPVGRQHPDCR